MFYYVFILATLVFLTASIFSNYTITKTETKNAITANSILENINIIEKLKKEEEENGKSLNSIYELNLPISVYLVKDDIQKDDITILNMIHKRAKEYITLNPLGTANCSTINSAGLFKNDEYENCITYSTKELNFFEDTKDGIKYNINSDEINKKLLINTNLSNKSTDDSNSYLYNNLSNKLTNNEEFSNLIQDLKTEDKQENPVIVLTILEKMNNFSNTKAIELLEEKLEKSYFYNNDEYLTKFLIKKVITILLNSDNEITITKNNYQNIYNFLNKNYSYVEESINLYYLNNRDKILEQVNLFLNKN